jgi:hypothetical protein
MGLEWNTITAWRDDLLEDRLDNIQAAFAEGNASGPEVVWSPAPAEARAPENRFLLDFWRGHAQGGEVAPVSAIDPIQMQPALGHVVVLEPMADGRDFRYRLYGSVLADVAGFDMTGKPVSAHPATWYIVSFTLALYQALLQRRGTVLASYAPVALYAASWERALLPFALPDGQITRIIAGNVAFDQDGRQLRS